MMMTLRAENIGIKFRGKTEQTSQLNLYRVHKYKPNPVTYNYAYSGIQYAQTSPMGQS